MISNPQELRLSDVSSLIKNIYNVNEFVIY